MIGYCATASSGIEIAPIKQMKSATTQAKIGLSMKKLGIEISAWRLLFQTRSNVYRGSVCLGPGLRLDLIAGRKFLDASAPVPGAGLQAIRDEPHAVLPPAGLHRLDGDAAIVLDHEHLAAAAAVPLDRLLRHGDGVAVDAL